MAEPYILLDDQIAGQVRHYADPVDIITATDPADVAVALNRLQDYHAQGYYLAGYMSYELGYLLEPSLSALLPDSRDVPLLKFAAFKTVSRETPDAFLSPEPAPYLPLSPDWTQEDYLARYERVMDYIQAGDVYQINLTFPMRGAFSGDALALYASLRPRQPVHYGGVVALDEGADIVSLSPELFFSKSGPSVTMQPMKGTVNRKADIDEDRRVRDAMQSDEKSRAENLMIVDLLRNDLSRIAARASVKVPELFSVESYPTLHQMTSKVTAKLNDDVDFKNIFKSLFPCGSVTGAPKIRAMEIIRELETSPRGAYCGALGYIDPDGEACFNVGIRTLTLGGGTLRYNVGSGIVLDSDGADEYKECLLKAKVVRDAAPSLIETFCQDPDGSHPTWPAHKARLLKSAAALGYDCDTDKIESSLPPASGEILRVRVMLRPNGEFAIDAEELLDLPEPLRLSISKNPLHQGVQEMRHKVSARDFYDGERMRIKRETGADEVLFVNQQGQLCEGSFTSLFVRHDDHLWTPDINAGLLPGVLRASLLQSGEAEAVTLYPKDLIGQVIYVGNSLRGLMRAKLISQIPV